MICYYMRYDLTAFFPPVFLNLMAGKCFNAYMCIYVFDEWWTRLIVCSEQMSNFLYWSRNIWICNEIFKTTNYTDMCGLKMYNVWVIIQFTYKVSDNTFLFI